MSDPQYRCATCGHLFTVKSGVVARYPGWKPSKCLECRDGEQPAKQAPGARSRTRTNGKKPSARKKKKKKRAPEENLPTHRVLERYTEGPFDGVFTDGACSGNPGPGGWGVVWVRDNEILDERYGHDGQTTNNRMELMALINAYEMLPRDADLTIWSDSNLCVRTINEWAAGWKRMGWQRKTGPVQNLELVKQAYELALRRPKAKLRWIKAHNGSRWNEYADALATAYLRNEK